jgi:hypothetical protein
MGCEEHVPVQRGNACKAEALENSGVIAARDQVSKLAGRQGFVPRAMSEASRSKPEDGPSRQRASKASEVGWVLGTEFATGW